MAVTVSYRDTNRAWAHVRAHLAAGSALRSERGFLRPVFSRNCLQPTDASRCRASSQVEGTLQAGHAPRAGTLGRGDSLCNIACMQCSDLMLCAPLHPFCSNCS